MSALEIVLVAVASFLLFIILLYVTVAVYVKKAAINKAEDFHIMDKFRLNHDVVFLGDSLTDFYPIEEFTDVKIVNRGIAGDTTSDVMHRVSEVVELRNQRHDKKERAYSYGSSACGKNFCRCKQIR